MTTIRCRTDVKNDLINRSLTCAYLPSQVITNIRHRLQKNPANDTIFYYSFLKRTAKHVAPHKSQHQHVIRKEKQEHTVLFETMLLLSTFFLSLRYLNLRCAFLGKVFVKYFYFGNFLFLLSSSFCCD